MEFFRNVNVDWMGKAKYFVALSLVPVSYTHLCDAVTPLAKKAHEQTTLASRVDPIATTNSKIRSSQPQGV